MTKVRITKRVAKFDAWFPVGSTHEAEASSIPGMREVSPGRWGMVDGRMCEIERAVFEKIDVPTWTITNPAGIRCAIPRNRAIEI